MFVEIPGSENKMASAWATSSTKADPDTGYNSEKQQISSISGTLPELDQSTEARVALTTREVVLPLVRNSEKDEEGQLKQKSQEKSPEEDRKMTMSRTNYKNSPQRLAKSKTVKFKLETTLKQAELALIESQKQYELCKRYTFMFSSILLTYIYSCM